MKVRVLMNEDAKSVRVYTSEMLTPAAELGYDRNFSERDIPKAILSLMRAMPSMTSVKVYPFMIELMFDKEMEPTVVEESVKETVKLVEPSFNLNNMKANIGGEGDLIRLIPLPFGMGNNDGFISIDDQFEDHLNLTTCILMIPGISRIRPCGNGVEVERSYFAKWDQVISQIEKEVRRFMRTDKFIYG
jgi:hypothetical protein